jgi:hypothetical protein
LFPIIALSVMSLSMPLIAQQADRLPVGLRVRIQAPAVAPIPIIGHVLAATRDSLVVGQLDGALRQAIPANTITEVAVSGGRPKARRAVIGAGIGFLTGMVGGAYLGGAGDQSGFGGLLGMMAGMVIGTPVGALVGAGTAPELWDVRPGGYIARAHPAAPAAPPRVDAADTALNTASPTATVAIVPGTEVRLTIDGASGSREQVRGRLVESQPAALVLQPRRSPATQAIPHQRIRLIEVRGGEDRRRGFSRGALIGGGITAILAAGEFNNPDNGRDTYFGTVLSNALIGALIGTVFAPKGWQRLPIQPTR